MIFKKNKILGLLSICFVAFSCTTKTVDNFELPKQASAQPLEMAKNADLRVKNEGKAIFKRLKCGACHMKYANVVGPSLKKIREYYLNQEKELFQFLIGKGKPKIDPEEYSKMTPNIEAFKKLSEEEKQKLIDFLLDK